MTRGRITRNKYLDKKMAAKTIQRMIRDIMEGKIKKILLHQY